MMAADYSAGSDLTVTVRSLRAQHEGAEILVGVVLENGEHREQRNLLITVEQYYEIQPRKGVIDEETFERLEEASALCNAIRCGENLLSYGANSAKTLAQKITRHGYSREIAARASERLCEMGLIDEMGDMEREVEKCLRKLWGKKRIQAHLWGRGFEGEVVSASSALLEEVDFAANCAALIRKHYGAIPTDGDETRRMMASLARYGYSLTEIRDAMRLLEN